MDKRIVRGLRWAAVLALVGLGTQIVPVEDAVAGPAGWRLPDGAVAVGPDVYRIATARQDGRLYEGYAFIDRRGHARGGGKGGNGGGGGTTCYAFIGRGARWHAKEDYLLDPSSPHGNVSAALAPNVSSFVAQAIAAWESAGAGDVFGNETAGAIQRGTIGSSMNDQNEIVFDAIAEPNVIAVTIVWGIFAGPPQGREIVEWDQIYDDVDFTWDDVAAPGGDPTAMDFGDIATHEIGHAFGMDHPDVTCTEETMYAYASLGETKKRTLEAGDIEGITALYK